ncbi:unnamed protein product [Durusdinium trenchii]|uniref:RRM domain-containing protein n=1 Tax=Durusdinium trenchii TaxID=1381693 RepID=A0ABP0IYJ5_9DINO
MAYLANSLFVRNLSPQVNETMIREIFASCDEIEKVIFKPYPNNETQFFAQINFKTSAGVSEGSKLSGTKILGVQCMCGVIDPIRQAEQTRQATVAQATAALPTEEDQANEEFEMQAEHVRKAKEAAEELRLRTCHIAGLAEDIKEESIRKLCEGFGEVETLRIDTATDGQTFGLVEFKETKVAHVVKMQRSFLVEDRVLVFTEAKSHVDNAKVEEMTVQFQAPIIDAMNMRSVLAQQVPLAEKLAKVKAAATEILPATSREAKEPAVKEKEKKEKKLKDKKDKKEKKEKKKDKNKEGKEKKDKKKDKEKEKKKEKKGEEMEKVSAPQAPQPKRPKDEAEAELMEEEEEEEMVDIDEEVEVLPEGEVVGLVGTSSSSSSSSDYGADALVELPMDVSKPDEVSDGDDVLCDAPTPLRPKGKGKGKVPRRPPGAPPGGRGGLGMRPARAPFTPAVCPNRRALRAAARVTGGRAFWDGAARRATE